MAKIKRNISLKKVSTFKIGGKAKYFAEVKNLTDLTEVISWAEKRRINYKIIGGGSNIVFPDEGFNGLIVKIKFGSICSPKPYTIRAGAGASLNKVVDYANRQGWQGLETLAGIPGTVGGAIYGNAGAYGRSISEVIKSVTVWRNCQIKTLTKNQCRFQYRHSIFKKEQSVIVSAELKLKGGNAKLLKEVSRKIRLVRNQKYRPGLRCPGSFFKNILVQDLPPKVLALIPKEKIKGGKVPAGYLLEQVGAKGMKLGGIRIADFHGNLLINANKGTAAEVKKLARILKKRVKKKFGVSLEEEIIYF